MVPSLDPVAPHASDGVFISKETLPEVEVGSVRKNGEAEGTDCLFKIGVEWNIFGPQWNGRRGQAQLGRDYRSYARRPGKARVGIGGPDAVCCPTAYCKGPDPPISDFAAKCVDDGFKRRLGIVPEIDKVQIVAP